MQYAHKLLFAISIATSIIYHTTDADEPSTDNHSEVLWLMHAHQCDQPRITEFADLTVSNFLVLDENGQNIYEIALQKHKETSSIPCVRMALFFQQQAEKLYNNVCQEIITLENLSNNGNALTSEQITAQKNLTNQKTQLELVIQKFEQSHV